MCTPAARLRSSPWIFPGDTRPPSGTVPEGVERDGSSYYYKCPISDTQTLEVAVQVEGTEYRVLKWQAVPTGQWEADQALDVWDGQIPE